jgi:hypothetical protein
VHWKRLNWCFYTRICHNLFRVARVTEAIFVMNNQHTSERSMNELRQLADNARARGDEYLAVMVAGLELFISLGREVELLEFMRQFEQDIRPAVEGTPTAEELDRLFRDGAR